MVRWLKKEALNSVLPLCAVLILFIILGIRFDFYYEFNDDVLIKDIISGRYTGTGDGHSVQMLYILGGFLALFYNMIPDLPWFALFLYMCFGGGLYLILKRSIMFCRSWWAKALLVVLEILLVGSLMLWELVFVQYTVVCGFLVATALFLFSTTPNNLPVNIFWKMNIGPVLLVVLAFFIRTEMVLLMSPFIAVAGIWHWSNEEKIFNRKNFQKYLTVIGAILIGCFIGIIGDKLAYASSEWKDFLDFFDARTQVYDYTWYPKYENAKDFYDNVGISKAQYQLMDSYNYCLDEQIDTEFLNAVVNYGEKQRNNGGLIERGIDSVRTLIYRVLNEPDAPYNYLAIGGYVLVALLAFVRKDVSYIWKIPLMGVVRCIPWLYLLISDRVPQRIWHPLYYVELTFLMAIIIRNLQMCENDLKKWQRVCGIAMYVFCMSITLAWLPKVIEQVQVEEIFRKENNRPLELFAEYAAENPENYYFMDVYSSVNFSEKVFKNIEIVQKNYDILGGWIAKSPLQKEVLEAYAGETVDISEMLLQKNFFFVINNKRDTTFMDDYYFEKNILLTYERVCCFGEGENQLVVYQITSK